MLSKGRRRDYALAGVGLGLACASKYTAGIVLVPFVAALAARSSDGESRATRDALLGVAICAAAALACFLLANPYSLLDYSSFHRQLVHQSTLSAEAQGKLGAPRDGGFVYYLWTLTWGLGWLPALAALGGAVVVWRRGLRYGWLLVPAPLLFLAFMGLQGRYFGRWLLPMFPLLCLLAAVFVLWCAERLARAHARLGVASALLLGVVTLAQGLVYSVHSGLVLSRADTRNTTRAWMLAHVPAGARIVAEPVSPDVWARERAVNLPSPAKTRIAGASTRRCSRAFRRLGRC